MRRSPTVFTSLTRLFGQLLQAEDNVCYIVTQSFRPKAVILQQILKTYGKEQTKDRM